MKLEAILFATGSFLLVAVFTVSYFSKVAEAKLTKEIGLIVSQFLVGLGMAVGSIVFAWHHGVLGAAVIAPASLAITTSGLLLFLLSQRKTPVGDLKVKVGDTLLPFSATTAEGAPFDSADLSGRRILLKFFRGGW